MEAEAQTLKEILAKKKPVKMPTYSWQDLALRIITELSIPNFKRNAVFKVCRDYPKSLIERAVSDTKELCLSGEKWKYFFKVIGTNPRPAGIQASGDRRQKATHTRARGVKSRRQ